MCTLGVYASNQACHMHRICSEPLLWESGHDKCTETRDIHVAGAALSAWTFPCISSCSDLPTRSDAFSGLAWPNASVPFLFDCHSMSKDFHCFSMISIHFQRFSSIFGVQKSPGSVRGFQRVSGGSGAVFGGPEAKKSHIYTMDLRAICIDC